MKTKKNNSEEKFSLIDPIIASAITIIVLVGIVALVFSGQKSNNLAIRKSYAVDAGDEFVHFNMSRIKQDLGWLNVYANDQPGDAEPSKNDWHRTPLSVGMVSLRPDLDFDPSTDNNSGVFLMEGHSGGIKDFTAVVRAWKNVITDGNGAIKAELFMEVSYPYDMPYNSPNRKKELFTSEFFSPPKIGLVALGGPSETPGGVGSADSNDGEDETTPSDDSSSDFNFGECIGAEPANINPGNSSNNQFTMVTMDPDIGIITRDCLLNEGSEFEYYGKASHIFIRPKGNGNSFTLYGNELDGYYPVDQNATYIITGDIMVYLYNELADQPGDKAKAMGHWYMCINANNAEVKKAGKNDSAMVTDCEMKITE